VRIASTLFLILCLAACQHGIQTNEAVRQGVIDHLAKAGMNVAAMQITVTSVEFNGNKASAVISMTAKGMGNAPPMAFKYNLEQQDKKWVVTGRDTSGTQHGSEAMPGANPHGGGMPAAAPADANPHGGGAAMPSPNDLPPAAKK
jgi:galactitol-specific phosphotransferase system IIB component